MKKPVLIYAPSCDEATISAVEKDFSALLGRHLEFDTICDAKLIGGFIAMIDGKVYDTSYSSRLNEIMRLMSQ